VKYKVDFTPQALEDISKLDRTIITRITKKIEWLSESLDVVSPQALKGKFHGMFNLVLETGELFTPPISPTRPLPFTS
jgi:mRNA-degrading endonuclease RelE of RelBE toxin-antitoxin system